MAIPAKLQNDIRQFQRLQQELAQASQQRAQLEMRVREITHTLEELKGVAADAPVYRSIGSLIVRAKDHKEVEDLLTDDKETTEVRLKALERQENHLKERYTTMQKEISEALRVAGAVPPESPGA